MNKSGGAKARIIVSSIFVSIIAALWGLFIADDNNVDELTVIILNVEIALFIHLLLYGLRVLIENKHSWEEDKIGCSTQLAFTFGALVITGLLNVIIVPIAPWVSKHLIISILVAPVAVILLVVIVIKMSS